jgi:phosphoribosylformylglycinamidine cyclo-ligase
MAITYRDAGVDLGASAELVRRLGPLAKRTRIPGVVADVGGFAGLFAAPSGIDEPILVSGSDGVGTKLEVAQALGVHDTIGIDLVAMSVNDIITSGAAPLFFLDYYATGRLDVDVAEAVVRGIVEGCRQSGCVLLGGETAEMPGFYAEGEYDVAGFAVGSVKQTAVVDGTRIAEGDVVVGFPSTGVHSNGFSLARAVIAKAGAALTDAAPWDASTTLGAALLTPTRIYVDDVKALLGAADVRGLVHVTGGGLPENVPRVLPAGLGVRVDTAAWARPPLFDWLQAAGGVSDAEMYRTFNMGVGLVAVVPAGDAAAAVAAAPGGAVIGEVVAGEGVERV